MSRLYYPFTLLSLVMFTAAALFIRAQPYDDGELRSLLMPDNCEMPCFLGIRPGLTTVDEAVDLLENHDWVSKVVRQGLSVYWFWNGSEPAFLQSPHSPSLSTLLVNGSDTRIVGAMDIPTRLPAGYIYLLLGKPATYRADPSNQLQDITSAHYVYLSVWFNTFTVGAAVECPTRLNNFWSAPVDLSLMGSQQLYSYWSEWDRPNLRRIMYHEWGCP